MKSALWIIFVALVSSAAAQVPATKKSQPLVIPEELEGRVDPGQAAHAANWALTFGTGDVSLTDRQRQNYNQDIANWVIARAKLAAEKYQILTGKKVELALGDIKRLSKQTVEIETAVAAILEQQKKVEAAARAKAAAEASVQQADDANAAFAEMQQQQALRQQQHALDEIRQKQAELEQQLRRLRR